MVKKPKTDRQPAKKKKRKAQSVAPRQQEVPDTLLGTVAIPVQVQVTLANPGVFNEARHRVGLSRLVRGTRQHPGNLGEQPFG